jgi:hypothetical protein
MIQRNRDLAFFAALAAAAFLIANLACAALARWWVSGQGITAAGKDAADFLLTQPVGAGLLLAPFALLAWMSDSLARERGRQAGSVLFALGAILLGLLYLWGYLGSAQALRDAHWTAAALSVGMLPIFSLPILAVLAIGRLAVGRRSRGS